MMGDSLTQPATVPVAGTERRLPLPPPERDRTHDEVAGPRDTLAFRLACIQEHLEGAHSAAGRVEAELGIGLPPVASSGNAAAKPEGVDFQSSTIRESVLYLRQRLERIAAVLA